MGRMLAFLQLCRAANLGTSLADIVAGALLAGSLLEVDRADPGWSWRFGALLLSSACLYTAGMVWNDVFDAPIDALERPRRPIPSGRIALASARMLGCVLVATGLLAAAAAGWLSALVAGLLTGCTFAYNGGLKHTPLGPLAMGSCRLFNLLLGATAAAGTLEFSAGLQTLARWPLIGAAAGLGIYITGVTWFARRETGDSRTLPLAGALLIANLGIGLLASTALNWPAPDARQLNTALLLGLIAVTIDRRALGALANPEPRLVQASIKTMLLSLIMLDAAMVLLVDPSPGAIPLYTLGVVALLVPSLLLARFLAVT